MHFKITCSPNKGNNKNFGTCLPSDRGWEQFNLHQDVHILCSLIGLHFQFFRANHFSYSDRKLLTGFTIDVLIDWKLIVMRVINRIAVSGAINIHHSKFILKAKLSNHLVIVR